MYALRIQAHYIDTHCLYAFTKFLAQIIPYITSIETEPKNTYWQVFSFYHGRVESLVVGLL